jgi:DMSO/TMAO reductase YedYZ molybdopterin-dependent catalytic subunit
MSSPRGTTDTERGDEPSSIVEVRGLVAQPRHFTRADLAALPQTTRTATFVSRGGERTVTYTGPALLDVIKAAGGIVEEQRLDRLRTYLVARSATGYEVVFSWGEIDASFGDGVYLLAHDSDDTASTPNPGAVRLVVPNDHHGGRYVGQLVELEVCAIARPPSTGA